MPQVSDASLRLLPTEQVLWQGSPRPVAHDVKWRLGAALLVALGVVSLLFAALLHVGGLTGVKQTAGVGIYLMLTSVAVWFAPKFLIDGAHYVITDRRILVQRGRLRRTMDRRAVTFGRIVWHPSAPSVGTLELVRAVPFGPLMRQQRLMLHHIETPDAVFAILRGAEKPTFAGDRDVSLASRLEEGEDLLWGGAPENSLGPSVRELAVAALGVGVATVALYYGQRVTRILVGLEEIGLPVRTWTWLLFFLATLLAFAIMVSVSAGLLWFGLVRSRALLRDTEYLLTDRRVIVRRGRVELSVDRRRIIEVVTAEHRNGCATLYLVLDGPAGRLLNDSGALSANTPARDVVPPILYEVKDGDRLRTLILDPESRVSLPSVPPIRDAA
ncbi:MAG: hypothetical protein IPK60_11225 [Sandaracinaceae bacterium]|nr:hypothetical protein [Sandaracinaceae bacterium]